MSDPLQGVTMEESILLDDESFMSPENENLPPESPLVALDKPEPPLPGETDAAAASFAAANAKSMENIMLETSPTEESVDLVSQGLVTDGSSPTEEDNEGDEKGEERAPEQQTGEGASDKAQGEKDNMQGANESEKGTEKENSNPGDISRYFSDPKDDGASFFDNISHKQDSKVTWDLDHPEDDEKDKELESKITWDLDEEKEDKRTRTTSLSSVGAVTSEEVMVSFEEQKGEGLKIAESLQNVSKYFTEDGGGTDEDGKNFFESFTAGDDTLLMSTSPRPDPIPPSVPGVGSPPGTVSPLSSPLHQQDTSRTHTTSMSSPSASPIHTAAPASVGGTGTPTPTPAVPGTPVPTVPGTPVPTVPGTPVLHVETGPPSLEVHDPSPVPAAAAPFQDGDDLFSASLAMSDTDRRNDAWIPSETTRQTLITMVTSAPGTYFPEPDQLTMPGLLVDDPQGDHVAELMQRFMLPAEASKRVTLNVDDVTQDEEGLRKLISAECLRSAVDLTGRILTHLGQGPDKLNKQSKHTPYSLQVWFTRIALLVKLRLYSHAESECNAFGSLDKPDLFYEFYPDQFGGRRGSMVPFSLRVLHAEIPQYLGKAQESLDRLFYIHAITQKILSNLASGLSEDGSMFQLTEESRKASRDLWESREISLLYSIGNCLLHIKDYSTAVTIFESLVKKDEAHKEMLWGGIGRIYLQMGDTKKAQYYFDKCESRKDLSDAKLKCLCLMNKGFLMLGQNQFSEAQQFFQQASQIEPDNAVAVNNMAVCWLYMGKLKEALENLENLVHRDPERFLQEGILFNLCTLYELESSRAMTKKQQLLSLVGQHKGNGFNVACLKMTA